MCGNITERSFVFLKALVVRDIPRILPDKKMKGSWITRRKGEAPLAEVPFSSASPGGTSGSVI